MFDLNNKEKFLTFLSVLLIFQSILMSYVEIKKEDSKNEVLYHVSLILNPDYNLSNKAVIGCISEIEGVKNVKFISNNSKKKNFIKYINSINKDTTPNTYSEEDIQLNIQESDFQDQILFEVPQNNLKSLLEVLSKMPLIDSIKYDIEQ